MHYDGVNAGKLGAGAIILLLVAFQVPALGASFSCGESAEESNFSVASGGTVFNVTCAKNFAEVVFELPENAGNASIEAHLRDSNAAKLVLVDKQFAFPAATDAEGRVGLSREFREGNHTVTFLDADRTLPDWFYGRLDHVLGEWYALPALALAALGYAAVLFLLFKRGEWRKPLAPGPPTAPAEQPGRITGYHVLGILLALVLAAVYVNTVWQEFSVGWETPFSEARWGTGQVLYLDRYHEAAKHSQLFLSWTDPDFEVMTDQMIHTWAGWLYANGLDPSALNPQHPPLAKYLFGYSAAAFGKPALPSLLAGLLSIPLLLYLSWRIIRNPFWAFVATLTFSTSSIFLSYATQTYLEALVLLWMLLAVFLIVKINDSRKTPHGLLLALAVLAGFGIAMKWSLVAILPLAAAFMWAAGKREWALEFVALAPLAAIPYLVAYSAYFGGGHTLLDFARFQAGTAAYWIAIGSTSGVPPLSVWQILFTGYAAYGAYHVGNWNPSWAVFGASAFAGAAYCLLKRDRMLILAVLWFFAYMLFFSTGPTWDRYILPALPAAIIIFFYLANDLLRRAMGAAVLAPARNLFRGLQPLADGILDAPLRK
ncbi:MAG: glycosyltransferase family 39 protein [Candidatus ainarchaeum sp.]|nr:glycosyltransferase family 39 protein [Candidatus ainarchaeum sp.]